MREITKDRICKGLCVISVLFILWVFASVIDTSIHNTSDLNYSAWNFFQVMPMPGVNR